MDWLDDLTPLLVPREPGKFLMELLRTLQRVSGVSGAMALFRRDQDELHLAHSLELDQAALDGSTRLWTQQREALLRGEVVHARLPAAIGHGLPVRSGERLVGLLYVVNARALTGEALANARRLCGLAATALATPEPPGAPAEQVIRSYLGRTSADDVIRDQMVGLLTANEWNVSRVARLLGVTRRTIYMRLQRFGLERVKLRVSAHSRRKAAK